MSQARRVYNRKYRIVVVFDGKLVYIGERVDPSTYLETVGYPYLEEEEDPTEE